MVFGWLCVGRGIGNVVSGPLSNSLLSGGNPWLGRAFAGFGSGYGSMILYNWYHSTGWWVELRLETTWLFLIWA
jgi:hypothetical protein